MKINKRRGSDNSDSNSSIFDRLYQNDKTVRQYFHSPSVSLNKRALTNGEDTASINILE